MLENSLSTVRRELIELSLYNISNDVKLDDLFGKNAGKMANLFEIIITYVSDAILRKRMLAANNFSALTVIEDLRLNYCGITSIQSNAFDGIAYTLSRLQLQYNHILTFGPTIFNRMIDTKQRKIPFIAFHINPLICSCELTQLLSHLLLTSHLFADYYLDTWCSQPADLLIICPNLQIVHPYKWGVDRLNYGRVVFPKFMIKLNKAQDMLTIQTNVPDEFRLWVQHFDSSGKTNCISANWIEKSIKCIILTKNVKTVALDKLKNQSDIAIICVSYVSTSPKKFWPLNCIGVRRSILVMVGHWKLIATVMTLSGVIGFLIGIAVGIFREVNKKNGKHLRKL